MTETKSEPTIIMEMVADAAFERMKMLAEVWQHPFGMEQVDIETWRQRVKAMGRDERAAFVRQIQAERGYEGLRQLIDLMREGGG